MLVSPSLGGLPGALPGALPGSPRTIAHALSSHAEHLDRRLLMLRERALEHEAAAAAREHELDGRLGVAQRRVAELHADLLGREQLEVRQAADHAELVIRQAELVAEVTNLRREDERRREHLEREADRREEIIAARLREDMRREAAERRAQVEAQQQQQHERWEEQQRK